jgi:small GTP-binding protein
VVIGDARVGKTSIISRYLKKYDFDVHEETTIGAMYDSIEVNRDDKTAELQIWDTAGQEQYRSLVLTYFRNAHGAALVFDVTVSTSFHNLKNWIETFGSVAGRDRPVVIIGNKTDLTTQRVISWDTAAEFAMSHQCQYLETSALTGEGIEIAFETLIDDLMVVALSERNSPNDQPPPKSCC